MRVCLRPIRGFISLKKRFRADLRVPVPSKWNRFRITMKGDRISVDLNGKNVIENAHLPGVAESGPIGLQHAGDPVEFGSLAEVYGKGPGQCALTSVKTNLGHLEPAAGVSGLIKTVLSMGHGQIPPNLHFSQWNPRLGAERTRFFVPTELHTHGRKQSVRKFVEPP